MYGGLAGTCIGASGSIGVGVGVGANLLFGGTGRSIALQPLSVEGSVGINLSLGVSGLTLALAQRGHEKRRAAQRRQFPALCGPAATSAKAVR